MIEAVAAGKRAAESIDGYLRGGATEIFRFEDTLAPVPEDLLPELKGIEKRPRARAKELPVAQRIKDFPKSKPAFPKKTPWPNANDVSIAPFAPNASDCVDACEKKAIDHHMKEKIINLEVGSVILTPGFRNLAANERENTGLAGIEMSSPVSSSNACFPRQVLFRVT